MTQRKVDLNLRFGAMLTRTIIGNNLLRDVGRFCGGGRSFARACIVTDDNVAAPYEAVVANSLVAAGISITEVVVPSGEASKSLDQVTRIYDALADHNVGRDGHIVAVGGGMVTDLAGFAAGTWMRGIPTVLCPTTLEADIDASIGGKTGVNHSAGKNLIGAFHHPELVVIDTHCLSTLSDRDLRAGVAESIKHAVIDGEACFAWHELHLSDVLSRDPDRTVELIETNVRIKADIVSRDVREVSGRRAILNFGHTIGHAIESECAFRYRHGECVALGMVAACRLSNQLGLCERSTVERIESLVLHAGLPIRLADGPPSQAILNRLAFDKKAKGGALRFVLIRNIGQLTLESDVAGPEILTAIESLQSN